MTGSSVLKVIENTDISSLDNRRINSLAAEAAKEILLKINNAAQRIEQAKNSANAARSMKSGWFGKTRRKADATADALTHTNTAVADMNALIQESVKFTQINAQLSKAMHMAMSKMMAEGFKDRDGHLISLNESGEEFANLLLQEAEDFSERQLEIETLQARQAEELQSVRESSKQIAHQLGKDIHRLQEETRHHTSQLKDIIEQRSAEILNRSDENDARQDLLIQDLQQSAEALRKASDDQDAIHTAQIAQLQELVQKQGTAIEELKQLQRLSVLKYWVFAALVGSFAASGLSVWVYVALAQSG